MRVQHADLYRKVDAHRQGATPDQNQGDQQMFSFKQKPQPTVHDLRQQAIASVNAAVANAIDARVDYRQLANLLEDHVENLRLRDAMTRPVI
jgi:hypothetical protein